MWTGSGATMTSATNRLELEHQIGPHRGITSWDFEQRARRYRLAAVLADSQQQAQTFCDLAMPSRPSWLHRPKRSLSATQRPWGRARKADVRGRRWPFPLAVVCKRNTRAGAQK